MVRYLAGEATEAEKEKLLRWRNASEENERAFSEMRLAWNFSSYQEEACPNPEQAWRKVAARITPSPGWRFLKVAAGIALLAGMGISFFLLKDRLFSETGNGSYTLVTSAWHKPEITLPDSTTVILNDGSSLRYPAGYNRNNREVFLSGQAYFEVKKGKPFTVHMPGGLKVKVLGTSFDVSAYERDTDVKVALVEGRVRLEAGPRGHAESTEIKPGTLVTYDKNSKQLASSELDVLRDLRWKLKELAFDNDSFDSLITALEKWYRVQIRVRGNTAATNRYTLKIRNETLEEALELLSTMVPMEYAIKDDQVDISIK